MAVRVVAVASMCSRNHLLDNEYKKYNHLSYISFTVVPCVLYSSDSDCEGVNFIPGSHFVKAFSALPSHS